jgi:hypothetical protein
MTFYLPCLPVYSREFPVRIEYFYYTDCEDQIVPVSYPPVDAVSQNLSRLKAIYGNKIEIMPCPLNQLACRDAYDQYVDSGLIVFQGAAVIVIGGIAETNGKNLKILRHAVNWAQKAQKPY